MITDLPWYDEATGALLLDDYVQTMPSYQRYLADSQVTLDELNEQGQTVIDKLRALETLLSPEAKKIATEALCELGVYVALQRIFSSNLQ